MMFNLLLFMFILFILLFLKKIESVNLDINEYNYLKKLYDDTDGINWKSYCNNWIFDTIPDYTKPCDPFQTWYGITCTSTHITGIYLRDCNLNGKIPDDISVLTALESLHLEENKLTGVLPTKIGLLNNLQFLYLNRNKLTYLPTHIGLLASLKFLELSGNRLLLLSLLYI